LDSENTFWSKGDPHDQRNFNVCWSYKTKGTAGGIARDLGQVADLIASTETIVGFNLAYDLQWLWKLGISTEGKRFWCCQVAEFLINHQTTPYPSLDEVGFKYTGERKLDVVKTQYWEKGINTDQVPRAILEEYAIQDAVLTEAVYLKQLEQVTPDRRNLFSIAMQDMVVLAEMRAAGMKYDQEFCVLQQEKLLDEIDSIRSELDLLHNVPSFNWASSVHLSALLYGGIIEEEIREPVGFFKTGSKVGQERYRVRKVPHSLPRMYKPLRGTESERKGIWSTSEDVLVKLQDGSKLISGILRIRELSKLCGTYFKGIPEKATDSHWSTGMVHGQFNQCVAVTGRLSSSAPNMQNIPEEAFKMFVSRYE